MYFGVTKKVIVSLIQHQLKSKKRASFSFYLGKMNISFINSYFELNQYSVHCGQKLSCFHIFFSLYLSLYFNTSNPKNIVVFHHIFGMFDNSNSIEF